MLGDLSFSSSFSLVSEMRWKPSEKGTNYTVDNCQELKFKKECCSQDASQYFILQFPWKFPWDSHQQKCNCLGAVTMAYKATHTILSRDETVYVENRSHVTSGQSCEQCVNWNPLIKSSEWFKAFGNTTYSIVILTWMTFKSLWMYFFASSLMLWSWL